MRRTKWGKELKSRERNNKKKDFEQNMKDKIRSHVGIKRISWNKERKRRTRIKRRREKMKRKRKHRGGVKEEK
jgi:hypothetical protein